MPASAHLSPGLFILGLAGQHSSRNGSGQPTARSPYPQWLGLWLGCGSHGVVFWLLRDTLHGSRKGHGSAGNGTRRKNMRRQSGARCRDRARRAWIADSQTNWVFS